GAGLGAGRPHARGGVPLGIACSVSLMRSSPRAWGCTVVSIDARLLRAVVPTRVGVYRKVRSAAGRPAGRPHARGGVPITAGQDVARRQSSPRAWGCTAGDLLLSEPDAVVPTRVGVYRSQHRR